MTKTGLVHFKLLISLDFFSLRGGAKRVLWEGGRNPQNKTAPSHVFPVYPDTFLSVVTGWSVKVIFWGDVHLSGGERPRWRESASSHEEEMGSSLGLCWLIHCTQQGRNINSKAQSKSDEELYSWRNCNLRELSNTSGRQPVTFKKMWSMHSADKGNAL